MKYMFYKNDNNNLISGKHLVNVNYELFSEKKDEYNLPIDGWYWFDDEDEAYEFFGIEKPIVEPPYGPEHPEHPDYVPW